MLERMRERRRCNWCSFLSLSLCARFVVWQVCEGVCALIVWSADVEGVQQ